MYGKGFFILALVLMLVYVLLLVTENPDQKMRLIILGCSWSSFMAGYVFERFLP